MADQAFGQDALLLADIPGSGSGPVTTTVIDPIGAVVASAAIATFVGGIRFSYLLPAILQTIPGPYTVQWVGPTRGLIQSVVIDTLPPAGMTRYELRISIAKRVGQVRFGQVTTSADTMFSDNTLVGGSDEYVEWFLMMNPYHPDAGLVKRVIDYNGAAMILDSGFSATPALGDEYVLFDIDPREIDRDINLAISELSPITRIPITLSGLLPDTNNIVAIPYYISHIHQIYDDVTRLTPLDWSMLTGRRVQLDSKPNATLRLIGLRHPGYPLYETSIIETNPTATSEIAAFHLHQARASGQALDFEEHLRRQLAAEQTAERAKRNSVTRFPSGTREVLP